ncbi:hypothetical protein QUC31_006720 [Theobroma cacao]|uniref:Uncharacterized protein LOC18585912 n=1 Tax=Theobroma cacao TaxID=3641 RepID=A0AB32UL84_THECC|nr:PREDICTED: uncharacterized protein LOC18585912 [Theobroma cacao]
MAPRGRSRKRSNTRMAAATDAMKPFGFPNNLVVKTIKELLNVYGEEGWPFIEDAAYKVLIEAILEKDNGGETSHSKEPAAETSGGTLALACSDVNPPNTALQISNDLDPASETSGGTLALACSDVNRPNTALQIGNDLDPASETCGWTLALACSDVNPPNTALQISNGLDPASETNEALGTANLSNESVEAGGPERDPIQHPGSTSHSTPSLTHTPPMPESNSTRQRRPYYGWICSDDEEDLVELTPGPLAEEMENLLLSLRGQRERKQRWNVKPEDI